MDLLETFIVSAAAERHYLHPQMHHFMQVIRQIRKRFGAVRDIPGYEDLEIITRPYLNVLRRGKATPRQACKASCCIVEAVRSFVRRNNL